MKKVIFQVMKKVIFKQVFCFEEKSIHCKDFTSTSTEVTPICRQSHVCCERESRQSHVCCSKKYVGKVTSVAEKYVGKKCRQSHVCCGKKNRQSHVCCGKKNVGKNCRQSHVCCGKKSRQSHVCCGKKNVGKVTSVAVKKMSAKSCLLPKKKETKFKYKKIHQISSNVLGQWLGCRVPWFKSHHT